MYLMSNRAFITDYILLFTITSQDRPGPILILHVQSNFAIENSRLTKHH